MTRPDSTERGDLLGPLSGRVIDVATRKPVSSAYVLALWKVDGHSATPPIYQATRTNADGRYYLGKLVNPPTYPARVADLTLYVYHSGYVAYRSDRYFGDNSERHDFAQEWGTVGLDRMTGAVSRVQHLEFLAPAQSILGNVLEKERFEANQERTGQVERGHKEGRQHGRVDGGQE